jgi:hypothetical protein
MIYCHRVQIPAVINKVIAATAPDQALDEEIFAFVHGWSFPLIGAARVEFDRTSRETGNTAYTSRFNAALSLLRDDLFWLIAKGRVDAADEGEPLFAIQVLDRDTNRVVTEAEHNILECAVAIAGLVIIAAERRAH